MEILTKELAQFICDKVFPQDVKDLLKITLADNSEIELYKQFWKYFKNRPLKYDLEETIIEAARIFEFVKQDVVKYRVYKEKLEILNKPESFYETSINVFGAEGDNSGLDAKESTFKGDAKTLSAGRTDTASKSNSKTLSRSGDSLFNEDFTDIEGNWKEKDKDFNGLIEGTPLDINLNSETPLDVTKATITTQEKEIIPTATPTPKETQEEDSKDPEVSYTNISLNKGLVGSQDSSLNSSKNLSSSSKSMENRNKSLSTNIWKKTGKTLQSKFSYGEKTLTALNYYVANFKESFFSSFNSLFIQVWAGYGQHSL